MSEREDRALQQLQANIIGQLTGRVYLRDWQHAAKTFLPGGQGNAGKVKFTFHTYFSINNQAWNPPKDMTNYGLLVKSVKLPTFNMDVQEMNQYNRKRLIQSKIKYQPIDITFHDDNLSQVTAMWDAYYRYNYADSWNPVVSQFASTGGNGPGALKNFNRRNIYDESISGDTEYGYRGDVRGDSASDGVGPPSPYSDGEKVPFFNNITVYGLWAGNYIAYTLINPLITTFNHDTYAYDDGRGTMENRMTIDYETVLYNSGTIKDGDNNETGEVPGFMTDANYDNRDSPLEQGGSNPGDIFKRMNLMGGEGNTLADLRTLGQLYDGGLDTVVDSAKNAAGNFLKETVLNKLGLGPKADTDAWIPTERTSGSMIGINNQKPVATQAVPATPPVTPPAAPPAGTQQNTGGGTT